LKSDRHQEKAKTVAHTVIRKLLVKRQSFTVNRDRITRVHFTRRIGTRISRGVRLFAMPAAVLAIFPYYRDYRYVVEEDTICIVDPEDHLAPSPTSMKGPQVAGCASCGDPRAAEGVVATMTSWWRPGSTV
jgi:hypothetical protein